MLTQTHPKVSAEHLPREAFIYIRQSTPRNPTLWWASFRGKDDAFLHVARRQPFPEDDFVPRDVLFEPRVVESVETGFYITFENPFGRMLATQRDEALWLPSTGPAQDVVILKARGGDLFRRARADGSEADEVRFERDKAGNVYRFIQFSNLHDDRIGGSTRG
jgi:hypothetical protein